jgi:MFS family permease
MNKGGKMNRSIDIDEAKVRRNEFGLWLGWTLATAVGMLVGSLLSIPLVNLLNLQVARVIVPVLTGFLIGLAQWTALRSYLVDGAGWVLAGGTSWAVGYALGLFLVNSVASTGAGSFIAYVLFGFIVAILQWPLLRREIPHVWMWILANILGWALGFYLSQVALNLLFDEPSIHPLASTSVLSTVSGLVAGAITGVALVLIVRLPEPVKRSA